MMKDSCYMEKLQLIRQKYGYQRPIRAVNDQNSQSYYKNLVGEFSDNIQMHKRNRIEQITKLKKQFNLSTRQFSESKCCPQNYTTRFEQPLKDMTNINRIERASSNSKINNSMKSFQATAATAAICHNKSSVAVNLMKQYFSNLGIKNQLKDLKKTPGRQKLDSKYLREKAKMTRSRILNIPESKEIEILSSNTENVPNRQLIQQVKTTRYPSTINTNMISVRASSQDKYSFSANSSNYPSKFEKNTSNKFEKNTYDHSHSKQKQFSENWDISLYENVQQRINRYLKESKK